MWNPLPQAATWLTERLGRVIDARALIDYVLQTRTSVTDSPRPTIIKAVLPKQLRFARVAMPGHPNIDALEITTAHSALSSHFGKLPNRMAYLAQVFPTFSALIAYDLRDLLLYGKKTIAIVRGGSFANDEFEMIWIAPWETGHEITIDSCGINKNDLSWLGDTLAEAQLDDSSSVQRVAQDAPMQWIATPQMAQFLSELGNRKANEWKGELGDPPKWMQGPMFLRGKRGKRANSWQPVLLVDAIVQHYKLNLSSDSLRKRFVKSSNLNSWLDAWDDHVALMSPPE